MSESIISKLSRRKVYILRTLEFVPDILLAGAFLLVWFKPDVFGSTMISGLRLVLITEFFLVAALATIYWHISKAFHLREIAKWLAIVIFIGFSFFWFMFSTVLNYSYNMSFVTAVVIWFAFYSKFQGLIASLYSSEARADFMVNIIGAFIIYVAFAMILTSASVPRFGVTEAISISAKGLKFFGYELHRELAFGFSYFAAVTVLEIFTGFRKKADPLS